MRLRTVLTIAGSDPSGGAGIQADLKTIAANNCYGFSAITAITSQNTQAVKSVYPVAPHLVTEQIQTLLDDVEIDAVKIGMLPTALHVKMLEELLQNSKLRNIVLDPVMVSTSGHELISAESVECIRKLLLARCRLYTPNIPEAERLLNKKLNKPELLYRHIKELSFGHNTSVLLKGGHSTGTDATDLLYDAETDEIIAYSKQKIKTRNTHGTGCTLSSSIASHLAQGINLQDAVKNAKEYLQQTMCDSALYSIGKGHGPLQHFSHYWK